MKLFLIAFIPIFVAMDAIGGLPMYIHLTSPFSQQHRRTILWHAVLTAGIAGVVFSLVGKVLFSFLGITVSDFKIAGGLILLVLAIVDLMTSDKPTHNVPVETVGVVPIGMPLIVGPAVLATLVIQIDLSGLGLTLVAFGANLAIAVLVFLSAEQVMRRIGSGGSRALSKITSVLLAAIGVMMVRVGIQEITRLHF